MKKPEGLDSVSIWRDDVSKGPYPPLGFVHVAEAELGNGDYFGLYWPLGREAEEPVVCDMLHDSWTLEPSFSSFSKFVEWLDANDWARGDIEFEDDGFGPKLFLDAKEKVAGNQTEAAINTLRKACASFPEASDYWFALAGQLRRAGQIDESLDAALAAFNAVWAFGFPSQGVLRMLRSPAALEHFPDDPVVQRAEQLTLDFGGRKENVNYPLLMECVETYLAQGRFVQGLSLLQNFAYMMRSETTAFQERQGFDLEAWQSDFSAKCETCLGDSRRFDG